MVSHSVHDSTGGEPFDAIVVGAGISGLAVTRDLVAAGRSVALFEARGRVGGRLDSVDGLDVGASWFWPNETRVQQLISDLGVAIHEQYLAGDAVYHDPGGTRRLQGNPIDVRSGRFVNGADSLARAVAGELPVGVLHLDTPVLAITACDDAGDGTHDDGHGGETRRRSGAVEVVTAVTSCHAAHVVLAMPPALVIERISFRPGLPPELGALAGSTPVWMGGTTKVVIRYPVAFWRAAGLSGSGVSHVGPMRELHDMSGVDGVPAALFGFVPAGRAGEPSVTEAAVVAQLVEMFGPEAAQPEAVHIRDWRTEFDTSPVGVEQLTAYERFGDQRYAEPAFDGRVHWSSTETSPDFSGHIEGALVAARRAADAVIAATAPTAATPETTARTATGETS